MGGKYGIIPAAVIHGRDPRYRGVHTIYVAKFYQFIMGKVNKSFWDRSQEGKTDELGNKWKPLNPKTHRYKPLSPQETGIYRLNGTQNVGVMSPNQRKRWETAYNKALKRTGHRRRASAEAFQVIQSTGGRTRRDKAGNRKTLINIRTGRLVASTRPGRIANNRYYPPYDQTIALSARGLRLKIEVPYAKDVDKVRPIIPKDISMWRSQAHKYAIKFALREYNRINNAGGIRQRRSS